MRTKLSLSDRKAEISSCRTHPPIAGGEAKVVYSARSLDHIERAFRFLSEEHPAAAQAAVTAIRSAVEHLGAHPLVGRRIERELRQLGFLP